MDSEDAAYQAAYDHFVVTLTDLGQEQEVSRLEGLLHLGHDRLREEDYQGALDTFKKVYDGSKQTYLGSLALANAAASAENLGNDTLALEYYTRIIDEYGFTAAESPKALFGQARLQQKMGNLDLAKATFQQLADQFPNSEFAKLATNSLAVL